MYLRAGIRILFFALCFIFYQYMKQRGIATFRSEEKLPFSADLMKRF